jgi:hypothetical protein
MRRSASIAGPLRFNVIGKFIRRSSMRAFCPHGGGPRSRVLVTGNRSVTTL